jgi:hypothetical protein
MCRRPVPRVNNCYRLLRALHERYADATGFVTLTYETEVFCSTRL